MEDLVTAVIAEVFNTLSFCLNRSVKKKKVEVASEVFPKIWFYSLFDNVGWQC